MQSGLMKTREWVLEYIVHNEQINPLMGWQSSSNTLSEVKMTFNSKDDAIDYAKKNKMTYPQAMKSSAARAAYNKSKGVKAGKKGAASKSKPGDEDFTTKKEQKRLASSLTTRVIGIV